MIDINAPIPMYVQLATQISQAISRGEYRPGDKLPSESTLCKQFGVSRITVRQALNLLISQDMVFSVHGKGTFVKTPAISQELIKIVSFSQTLHLKGLNGHTVIQDFHPNAHGKIPNNCLGNEISSLELLGYASQTPVVFYRSFFKPDLGKRMWETAKKCEQAHLAFSTYDLYSQVGIMPFRIEQTLQAVNATPELETLLRLPTGKALIVLESIYYSIDGDPMEYKTAYYRSDVYSFHIQRQI